MGSLRVILNVMFLDAHYIGISLKPLIVVAFYYLTPYMGAYRHMARRPCLAREFMPDETIEKVENTAVEETENSTEETTEDSLDYDAELELLGEQKRKNFENAKKRIEGKKELPVDEIINKAVSKAKQEFISQFSKDAVEEELSKIENPKKREIVRHHYENSIVHSGTSLTSVKADIEKALAITDLALLKKRNTEELVAKEAKESVGKGTGMGGSIGSSKTNKEDYEKILTPAEISWGNKRGWNKEMFNKAAQMKKKRGAY